MHSAKRHKPVVDDGFDEGDLPVSDSESEVDAAPSPDSDSDASLVSGDDDGVAVGGSGRDGARLFPTPRSIRVTDVGASPSTRGGATPRPGPPLGHPIVEVPTDDPGVAPQSPIMASVVRNMAKLEVNNGNGTAGAGTGTGGAGPHSWPSSPPPPPLSPSSLSPRTPHAAAHPDAISPVCGLPQYVSMGRLIVAAAASQMATGGDNNTPRSATDTARVTVLLKIRDPTAASAMHYATSVVRDCVASASRFPVLVEERNVTADACRGTGWTKAVYTADAAVCDLAVPAGPDAWIVVVRNVDARHAAALHSALIAPGDANYLRRCRVDKSRPGTDTPAAQFPALTVAVTTPPGQPLPREVGLTRALRAVAMPAAVNQNTAYLFLVPEREYTAWATAQNQTRNLTSWHQQYTDAATPMTAKDAVQAANGLRVLNLRCAYAVSALDLVATPTGAHANTLNAVMATMHGNDSNDDDVAAVFPYHGVTAVHAARFMTPRDTPELLRVPGSMLPQCVNGQFSNTEPGTVVHGPTSFVVVAMVQGIAPVSACTTLYGVECVRRTRVVAVPHLGEVTDWGDGDDDAVADAPPAPPETPDASGDEDDDGGAPGCIGEDADDDGGSGDVSVADLLIAKRHQRRGRRAVPDTRPDAASVRERALRAALDPTRVTPSAGVVCDNTVGPKVEPPLGTDTDTDTTTVSVFRLTFPTVAAAVATGRAVDALFAPHGVAVCCDDAAVVRAVGRTGSMHVQAVQTAATRATHWKDPATDKVEWGRHPSQHGTNDVPPGVPVINTAPVEAVAVLPPQATPFFSNATARAVAQWVTDSHTGMGLHGTDADHVVEDAARLVPLIESTLADAVVMRQRARGASGNARVVVVMDPAVAVAPFAAAMAGGDTLVIGTQLNAPPLTATPWTAVAALCRADTVPQLLDVAVTMLDAGDDMGALAATAPAWCAAVWAAVADQAVPPDVEALLADRAEVEDDLEQMRREALAPLVNMPLEDLEASIHATLQPRQIQIIEALGNNVVDPTQNAMAEPPGMGLAVGKPWPSPTFWFAQPSGEARPVSCAGMATSSWSCGQGWSRDGMHFVEVVQGVVLGVATAPPPGDLSTLVRAAMLAGPHRREAVDIVSVADVEAAVVAARGATTAAAQAQAAGYTTKPAALPPPSAFMETPASITAGVTEAVMAGIQTQRQHSNPDHDVVVRQMDALVACIRACHGLVKYLDPDAPTVPEATMGVVDERHPNTMGRGRDAAPFHQLVSRVLKATETVVGRRGAGAADASAVPSAPGANFGDMVLVANTGFVASMVQVAELANDAKAVPELAHHVLPNDVQRVANPAEDDAIPLFVAPEVWVPKFRPDVGADALLPHDAHVAVAKRHSVPVGVVAVAPDDTGALNAAKHVKGSGGDAGAAILLPDDEDDDTAADAGVAVVCVGAGAGAGTSTGTSVGADTGSTHPPAVRRVAVSRQHDTVRSLADTQYRRAVAVAKKMLATAAAARKYVQAVKKAAPVLFSQRRRQLFATNAPVVVAVATAEWQVPALLAGTAAAVWMHTGRQVGVPFWDPATPAGAFAATNRGWVDTRHTPPRMVRNEDVPMALRVTQTFVRGMAKLRPAADRFANIKTLVWGLTHRVLLRTSAAGTGAGAAAGAGRQGAIAAREAAMRQFPDEDPPVVVANAHLQKIIVGVARGTPGYAAVERRAMNLHRAFTVYSRRKRLSRQWAAQADLATRKGFVAHACAWVHHVATVAARGNAAATVAAMEQAALAIQCMGAFAVPGGATAPPDGYTPPPVGTPPEPTTVGGLKAAVVQRMARRAPFGLRVPLCPGAVLRTTLPPPLSLNVAAMSRAMAVVALVRDSDVGAMRLGAALPIVATAVSTPTAMAPSSSTGVAGGAVSASDDDGVMTPSIARALGARGLDTDTGGRVVSSISSTTSPTAVTTTRVLLPGRARAVPDPPPVSTAELAVEPTWARKEHDPRQCFARDNGVVVTAPPTIAGLVTRDAAVPPAAALHVLYSVCNIMHATSTVPEGNVPDLWVARLQRVPAVVHNHIVAAVGCLTRVAPQALAGVSTAAIVGVTSSVFRDVRAVLPTDAGDVSAADMVKWLPQWAPFLAAVAAVLSFSNGDGGDSDGDGTPAAHHAVMHTPAPAASWRSMHIIREAAVLYLIGMAGVAQAGGLRRYVCMWGAPNLAAFGTTMDATQPGLTCASPSAVADTMRRALYWQPVKAPGSTVFVAASRGLATQWTSVRVWAPHAHMPASVWADVQAVINTPTPPAAASTGYHVTTIAARLVAALDTESAWSGAKQYAVWVVRRHPGTDTTDVAFRVGFAVADVKGMSGGCPVAFVTPMLGGGAFGTLGSAAPNPAFRPDLVLMPTYAPSTGGTGCTAHANFRVFTAPMAVAAVFVTDVTALWPLLPKSDTAMRTALRGLTASAVGTITKAVQGDTAVTADAKTKWADAKRVASTACRCALQHLAANALPVAGKTVLGVGATGTGMCVMFTRV